MNGHRPIVGRCQGQWWPYDFKKNKKQFDFNGDRAVTLLTPPGAGTGTARCKWSGGACTGIGRPLFCSAATDWLTSFVKTVVVIIFVLCALIARYLCPYRRFTYSPHGPVRCLKLLVSYITQQRESGTRLTRDHTRKIYKILLRLSSLLCRSLELDGTRSVCNLGIRYLIFLNFVSLLITLSLLKSSVLEVYALNLLVTFTAFRYTLRNCVLLPPIKLSVRVSSPAGNV